ncbi:pseudaminic acid synthase [Methanoculleus receptaculi]|uniref:Pseudaminic acid synthase n=1 Tax=Methanoculleus receptaculi TaxID=394967 RepID=A0AAX4FS45_9EURY|nr:pseudaminic acid synthase [Methanoculleus receptaculi]WOX56751.1 pseudaminic acid synthase [Methanoculleus receptaculi]
MKIAHHTIDPGAPPLIIAEMSGNHNQSLDKALEIVEAAAKAGAQALKLQTYTADTMTLDINEGEFFIEDEQSPWKGKSLHDLYTLAHTPWEWHAPIMERARELGMICFSTPFDRSAVDFLENLGVPAYKIASFEIVDLPLIRYIAGQGKPIILSTGMATLAEIDEAVHTIREAGNDQIALLKCTSAYPAPPEEMNLRTIPHLAAAFGAPVGLSDHTLGIATSVAAVALGACIIEKHFTLSRADPGPDSAFSLEPHEFKAMVDAVRETEKALGTVCYEVSEHEKASRVFRRSLFAVRDIEAGEVFTEENVRSIRPGYGLPPKYLPVVLGRRAAGKITRGTPLSWDLIL